MIIVGTYSDGIELHSDSFRLKSLSEVLSEFLPSKLGLHLLPFYPNSGDFGFAVDDWFHIRKDLGDWDDLSSLASRWRLLVDGIYNHVGVNHKWIKGFLQSPESYFDILHAYKANSPADGPISPRGQPVLSLSTTGYYLWKTFSDSAVDIRLESSIVQDDIDAHLRLLALSGVWGVRLDAVAYYAKGLGMGIRHNPGVYALANYMADKVRSYGFQVLAQLDCDDDGIRYYTDPQRRNIPLHDFTYSTCLALSILDQNPLTLMNHVAKTQETERILIRAPRTHDGILLRSKLLSQNEKNRIIAFAESNKLPVRMSSGSPYEINCSAPYLFSLLASDVDLSNVILFTMAVTGMLSGWSYFYLPYIVGHIPEHYACASDFQDPRAINRQPVNGSTMQQFMGSSLKGKVVALLKVLDTIHASQGEHFTSRSTTCDKLLRLTTVDKKYTAIANFSRSETRQIPASWGDGEVLAQSEFNIVDNSLDRLGFVILRAD